MDIDQEKGDDYKRFLGYDCGPNGGFVGNKEQAKTVQLIYSLFLEGLTAMQSQRN